MQSPKPVIGVTGPNQGAWPAWICIRILVAWAGGKAVHLTPSRPVDIGLLDGLIMGGGADIDPTRYKEKLIQAVKRETKEVRRLNFKFIFSLGIWLLRKLLSLEFTTAKEDKDRDEFEFNLLKQAVAKGIPVLGICRGAQLINVYYGGTLYQDIREFYTEGTELFTLLPKVTVLIDPQSRLHQIFGKKAIQANSLHHQSVRQLGHGLKVSAMEPNGIVEGIEHTEHPFMIGVQWHPEFLILYRKQRQIFHSLVRAASEFKLGQLSSLKSDQDTFSSLSRIAPAKTPEQDLNPSPR